MKNIWTNFFYQAVFQLTKIIIPMITIPIVSKALEPEGIGEYNYTYSVTQYFILFAGVGISLYGSREIAYVRTDYRKRSQTFWEIFLLKAAIFFVVYIAFLLFSLNSTNTSSYLILSLSLLSVLFDTSWFFMGMENFKVISLLNLTSQSGIFLATIFFIKKPADLSLYLLLQSLGLTLPQFCSLFLLRGQVSWVTVTLKGAFHRLKDALKLFIPQVAISVYTNLNKILIGSSLGVVTVAYYANAVVLNTVFVTLIATLDTVMLPRMSYYFANKRTNKMILSLQQTVNSQLFFSIAIMFGILTIYDKLVPWFFGSAFLFVNQLIPYFSVLIVVVPLGMSISRQYLIPVNRVNEYNFSVLLGAVLNLIVGLTLLPFMGVFGIVIAYSCAEIFVLLSRLYYMYKHTNFRLNLPNILKYLLSGGIMLLITRGLSSTWSASLLTNGLQILLGSIIYFICTQQSKVNVVFQWLLIRKNQA